MSGNARSSHRRCSERSSVLRNLANFTGKRLCQGLFSLIKLQARLWHRRFPVKFAKFLRTPFFTEQLWATASSSFKWRVTVSGELIFLESCGNCDVTNTVTLLL